MRFYELAYLVSLNTEKPDDIYQEINQIIEREGGKISQIESPHEVNLAHPIRKEIKAILASIAFYLEAGKLEQVKEKLKVLSASTNTKETVTPLLRFLIIRREPPKENKTTEKKIVKEKLLSKEKVKPISKKAKKVELKEVNQKIEEILKEQNES